MLADFTYDYYAHGIPGVIVKCTGCGLLYKKLASRELVDNAYSDNVMGIDGLIEYMDGGEARSKFRDILSTAEKLMAVDAEDGLRILDVGCGGGALLEEAASMGMEGKGLDICPGLLDMARSKGLDVDLSDLDGLDIETGYDIVTLMDIVEHTLDPMQMLRRARTAMKTGGLLVISTPNHASLLVRAALVLNRLGYVNPAKMVFSSCHVVFFDKRTLERSVKDAGFRVEDVWLRPYDRPGIKLGRGTRAAIAALEVMGCVTGGRFRMTMFAKAL